MPTTSTLQVALQSNVNPKLRSQSQVRELSGLNTMLYASESLRSECFLFILFNFPSVDVSCRFRRLPTV